MRATEARELCKKVLVEKYEDQINETYEYIRKAATEGLCYCEVDRDESSTAAIVLALTMNEFTVTIRDKSIRICW